MIAARTAVLSFATPSAQAASVLPPGLTVGLPWGAALPQGVFAISDLNYGRGDAAGSPSIGEAIPLFVYSTPVELLGARLEFIGGEPAVWVSPQGGSTRWFAYNPLIGGILAWNLGNGFSASYFLAAFIPVGGPLPQLASAQILNGAAVSYVGDGFDLTANLIFGITTSQYAYKWGGPQLNTDTLNLDLTATKKFDKLEIGAIAYGSTDLGTPGGPAWATYSRAGQFALGGLVGYDFGPFTAQFYMAHDLVTRNAYNGAPTPHDTRGWFRLIVPLWLAPSAPATAVAKY